MRTTPSVTRFALGWLVYQLRPNILFNVRGWYVNACGFIVVSDSVNELNVYGSRKVLQDTIDLSI